MCQRPEAVCMQSLVINFEIVPKNQVELRVKSVCLLFLLSIRGNNFPTVPLQFTKTPSNTSID